MCSAMCAACEPASRWDVMLHLHEEMAVTLDTAAYTALMKLYGRCSQWPRALEVFSTMLHTGLEPDTFALGAVVACVPWNHVLALLEDAWLHQRHPNLVVYNSAISSCGLAQWRAALALMEDLEKRGLQADAVTCGSLVAACEKGSQWQMAMWLFSSEPELRNVVSGSSAISACAKANEAERAMALLKALPGMQIQPSAASFNAASTGQHWETALQLLQAAKINGIKATSKSLMAQLKASEKGSLWQDVLALMRGDVQLGIAIRACHQASQWQRALTLFSERCAKGVPPVELWNAAMAGQENWQHTLMLFEGLQRVLPPDAFSCNLAMKACEMGQHWQGTLTLLRQMLQLQLDDVLTYHMVMTTCMESWRWETCLSLLQDLESSGSEPGLMTYGPAVGACLRTLQWEHALLLVRHLWAKTLTPDTTMCNAVITVCERSGRWAWALQLLQEMGCSGPTPDVTTRNAVINACATGSCWEAALAALAARAQALGLQKNLQGPGAGEALGAALRACSLAMRWREALELPRRTLVCHFAVLDACCRSNRYLDIAQLREETGKSLVATSKEGGDHSESVMAAVMEELQDLGTFGDEVAAVGAFQAPVTRSLMSLMALTRGEILQVDLGGEMVLRDPFLERQSSLGPFFVRNFLSNVGFGPEKAWLEDARAKSRRIMEVGTFADPMAKDILAYVASNLHHRGAGRIGGYRAECWKALPAVHVEHHRFPHAERQALLDLLRSLR